MIDCSGLSRVVVRAVHPCGGREDWVLLWQGGDGFSDRMLECRLAWSLLGLQSHLPASVVDGETLSLGTEGAVTIAVLRLEERGAMLDRDNRPWARW